MILNFKDIHHNFILEFDDHAALENQFINSVKNAMWRKFIF